MARKDWEYVGLPKLLIQRLEKFLQTDRSSDMGIKKNELLRKIISDYLDEQDILYGKRDLIDEFIKNRQNGEHFAISYEDSIQFEKIITNFVKINLNKKYAIVLLVSKLEEKNFLSILSSTFDISQLMKNKRLTIIHTDDLKINEEHVVKSLIKKINDIVPDLLSSSNIGISIVDTLAGNLIKTKQTDIAFNFEIKIHKLIQTMDFPITVMCLYPPISSNLKEQFLQCHDLIKQTVCHRSDNLQ